MSKRKKLPKSVLQSKFYQDTIRPVPTDVWRACVVAYQSAARFVMPVTNPEEYKIGIGGKVYGFTDTPMNRGMVAIKELLREEQRNLFPSIASRIMALGGVMKDLRTQERFAKFFQPEAEDGSVMVSEALLEAFASAPFLLRTLEIDLQALYKIATEALELEGE